MEQLDLPPQAQKRPWVVLKYGGTSVSTAQTWSAIQRRAEMLLPTHNVWITVSAISQVTNRLISCIDECVSGQNLDSYAWICNRHVELCRDIGLKVAPGQEVDSSVAGTVDDPILPTPVRDLLCELLKILEGVRNIGGEVTARTRARILAMGELMSSHLGRIALERGVPSELLNEHGVVRVDARTILKTSAFSDARQAEDDRFLEADVRPGKNLEAAEKASHGARLVISQGFIASTSRGNVTCVLGRGGSDTSGALFAALLGAERYEIWTDVHGMFTADPRHVTTARHIEEISYREAQELAAMGAKVLHPRCLGPAAAGNVVVEIRNTMDPDAENFTRICSADKLTDDHTTVMAVSRRTGQVLITVTNFEMWGTSGFLSKVFAPFDRLGISVDLIATSQYAVSMTLDHIPGGVNGESYNELIEQLNSLGKVEEEKSCAVVSIVGRRLRSVLHLMADAFKALVSYEVFLLCESTEDLNLSFVIHDPQDGSVDQLVRELHHELLEKAPKVETPPLSPKDGGPLTVKSPLSLTDSSRPSLFGSTWAMLSERVKEFQAAHAKSSATVPKVVSEQPKTKAAPSVVVEEPKTIQSSPIAEPVTRKIPPASPTISPVLSPKLHPTNVSLLGKAMQTTSAVTASPFKFFQGTVGGHTAANVYHTTHEAEMQRWYYGPTALAIANTTPEHSSQIIVHLGVVAANAKQLVTTASSHGQTVVFDTTVNSHPSVVRVLHGCGVGFSCESIDVVRMIRSICGPTSVVIFAPPSMCSVSEYQLAASMGCDVIADDVSAFHDVTSHLSGGNTVVGVDFGDIREAANNPEPFAQLRSSSQLGCVSVSVLRGEQLDLSANLQGCMSAFTVPALVDLTQSGLKSLPIVAGRVTWVLGDQLLRNGRALVSRVTAVRSSTVGLSCSLVDHVPTDLSSIAAVNVTRGGEAGEEEFTLLGQHSKRTSNVETVVKTMLASNSQVGDLVLLVNAGRYGESVRMEHIHVIEPVV